MFARVRGGWEVPPFLNGHTHSEWNAAPCLARADGYAAWLRRVLELPPDPARVGAGIEATPGWMRRGGIGSILDHGLHGTAVGREGLAGRHHREFLRDLPAAPRDATAWAPHAVHTVSASALAALQAFPGPISVHAGEAEEEMALYATGRGPLAEILLARGFAPDHVRRLRGRTPAGLLDEHGLLSERTVIVHAIHLPDSDLDLIAKRGALVVLCPLSNRAMGTGFGPADGGRAAARVRAMRERRIRVALGTDSALSAPTLSLLENARVLVEDGLCPDEVAPMLWAAAGSGMEAPLGPSLFVPETDPDPAASLLAMDI